MKAIWSSTALLIGGSLLAATAHAQVYKCIDAKGKTVYLQHACPRGAKSTTIQEKKRPAVPASRENDSASGKNRLVTPASRFNKR